MSHVNETHTSPTADQAGSKDRESPSKQGFSLTKNSYFCHTKKHTAQVARYGDMFSAMGMEPRLRIMQLLLSAHPDGMVVGEIQERLDIPNPPPLTPSGEA